MAMMEKEMPMDEGMRDESESTSDKDQLSAFVPAEFFAGEDSPPKVGDHPSIVVKDIDPETGQYELACDYGEGKTKGGSYESDFDRAMPAEEMEA